METIGRWLTVGGAIAGSVILAADVAFRLSHHQLGALAVAGTVSWSIALAIGAPVWLLANTVARVKRKTSSKVGLNKKH